MQTRHLISSKQVEKLKQKARKLKKETGIQHHEALDQTAKDAGLNHWHQVTLSANAFSPTEQAYKSGVIIAMDIKDAYDGNFHDENEIFIEDDCAFVLCGKDIYNLFKNSAPDVDDDGNDLPFNVDWDEWKHEDLSNYVFFRYSGPSIPENVNDVVNMVRECCFWTPEFIWHKGTFQESPSSNALDEDGNVVGVRF